MAFRSSVLSPEGEGGHRGGPRPEHGLVDVEPGVVVRMVAPVPEGGAVIEKCARDLPKVLGEVLRPGGGPHDLVLNLMGVMLTAQFMNGVVLPVLLVFMAIIASDKRIMGVYRVKPLSRALIWLTVSIVTALTAVLLVMQAAGIA